MGIYASSTRSPLILFTTTKLVFFKIYYLFLDFSDDFYRETHKGIKHYLYVHANTLNVLSQYGGSGQSVFY